MSSSESGHTPITRGATMSNLGAHSEQSEESVMQMVEKDPTIVRYLDRAQLTEAVQMVSINASAHNLSLIPNHAITVAVAAAAVRRNRFAMKWVPESLKAEVIRELEIDDARHF